MSCERVKLWRSEGAMDLSVVLPAIDERDNIQTLIPRLRSALEREGLTFEIIVVDGGSLDGTREAAEELLARVIDEKRRGYAGAIESGLAEARGDYVLTLDADLSHDPRFIARMWRARELGDIVIASRYVRGGTSQGPAFRKDLSRLLNEVQRRVLMMPVRDLSSGFRLYRRAAVEGIRLQGQGFEVQQELLVKAFGRGFRVVEVPFHYFPRVKGQSHAQLLRLAIGYALSTYRLRQLRNLPETADFDERSFYSLRPMRRRRVRRRHRIVSSWARMAERTLHVGCGSELITHSLNNAIGIDVNFGKLCLLRRYGITVVCASGEALPFREGSFDCVVGSNAGGSEIASDRCLNEMRRVLSPGGMLIKVHRGGASAPAMVTEKGGAAGAGHFAQNDLPEVFNAHGFAVHQRARVARGEEIIRCRRTDDYKGSQPSAPQTQPTPDAGCDPEPIGCSLGIMAHNEAANIGRLLESLVSQRTRSVVLREIIVIASGCTDETEAIVRQWRERDSRIDLVVQATREGKASAVNCFLSRSSEPVLLLCGADLLAAEDTVEQLVAPFADPEVAMTGSRPVPVNNPHSLMGFAAHLLWNLHHQINLREFKAGELIAFRRIFRRIPNHTAVDEASVESVIRAQGYQVRYVGSAIIYNKGPETVRDFLRQRRRIHAGHLALRDAVGYRVATLSGFRVLGIALRNMHWNPREAAWTCAVAALEAYGRFLGRCDYARRRDHSVWDIARTTKQLRAPAPAKRTA